MGQNSTKSVARTGPWPKKASPSLTPARKKVARPSPILFTRIKPTFIAEKMKKIKVIHNLMVITLQALIIQNLKSQIFQTKKSKIPLVICVLDFFFYNHIGITFKIQQHPLLDQRYFFGVPEICNFFCCQVAFYVKLPLV